MAGPSNSTATTSDGVACLQLVGLPRLMASTSGRPEISIGLIDGPVTLDHPDLAAGNIREVPGKLPAACIDAGNAACTHGTFIAGILLARRASVAPAICPGCSLLVRAIFSEAPADGEQMPSATAADLAEAIIDVIDAGARVINLSVALQGPSPRDGRGLQEALDFALHRGVVVVAAAGNQGAVGRSVITRHPWVIPVIAYDLRGRPMGISNLGASIGRGGLGAPGESVTSLGVNGPLTMGGTSAATPFVTGAVGLIWSEFPTATAAEVKAAVIKAAAPRRSTILPPLLNAWASYQAISNAQI
ncbi:MAG: S8 family serine peptidase [Acetobacteraceae bacterium]|nr:S8 family serine peptidase [Acetobacteraceae bacterium]